MIGMAIPLNSMRVGLALATLVVLFVRPALGWTTRPGWSPLPLQDQSRIQVALARGCPDEPSAVFPLTTPGKPVACWWDDRALHVGGHVFEFSKLHVEPKNGASFSVKVPIMEGHIFELGRKEMSLDVVLDENAADYAIPDFGILGNQEIDLPVTIVSKRVGSVRVFSNAVGHRSPRFIRDKILKVKPGEKVEVRVVGPAPDSGNHILNVYDADGTVLFMSFQPFHDPSVKVAYTTTTSIPEKQIMRMRLDQWLKPDDRCRLHVRMTDLFTGADAGFDAEKDLEPLTGVQEVDIDVSSLKPGTFKVFYDVKDAKGKVLLSDYSFYAKPDGKCIWDDTTYGNMDWTPPPWTNPVFTKRTFSCWNREIRFEKGLVSSMTSGGREILAAPVQILWNGEPLEFDVQLVSKRVSYGDYLFVAKNAPVSLRMRAEFDGFMWFDLEYAAPVEKLQLVTTMRRDRVLGFDDCSDPIKKLALPVGFKTRFGYDPGPKPWYWAGTPTEGLLGGNTTLRGWHCRNQAGGYELDVGDKTVRHVMNFVDEPLTKPEKRTVGFYLQPTPVKPKNIKFALQPRSMLTTWTGNVANFFDVKLPGLINDETVAKFKAVKARGNRVFWYTGTRVDSPIQPWWGWLGQEWDEHGDPGYFAEENRFKSRAERDRFVCCAGCLNSKSFRDYKIWNICWFMSQPEYGVEDLYFDLAGPSRCCNPTHACVWRDDFGRRQNDWALLGCREVHKRCYREMKKKNPDGAMIGHLQRQRTPSDVFFDRVLMGETYDQYIRGTMSYYDVLNPEMMQIQYAARSAELVVDMIPQIARAMGMFEPHLCKAYDPHTPEHDRINRHATAYFKIHDLEIIPQPQGANQWSDPDRVLKDFGAERKHYAYYKADGPVNVSSPHPRFIWALFEGNGRKFLITLNDTDSDLTETISIKGVDSPGVDIFSKKSYDFTPGSCTVTLPPRESLFVLWSNK